MKVSLLCCLFIVLSVSTPVFSKNQMNIDILFEQSQNCSLDQAGELSKDISEAIKEYDKKIITINKKITQSKEQLEQINQKREDIYKDFTFQRTHGEILLIKTQYEYPFYFKNIFDCLYSYQASRKQLRSLSNISSQYEKIMQDYDENYSEYSQLENKLNDLNISLSTLNLAQDTLFERFSHDLSGFNEEGQYDVHKTIKGSFDLNGYGAIYTLDRESFESCLVDGEYAIDSYSLAWLNALENGTISAGTWSYPNGGLHLGIDIAVPLYTSVYAPANGVILYADAPVDSNNGYLSNWCGWPNGGGNTICMICAVDGKLFGVTFAHLSNQIYVYPGQQVFQGDTIALSGNSGNSTGPHTHIEVFELKVSLKEAIDYFMIGADFSFGNGFSAANTCSQIACRIRPETVF